MQNPDAHKQLIVDYLAAFSRGDIPAVLNFMTEDAVWWVSGSIEGMSGTYTRDSFGPLLEGAKAMYKSGALKFSPISMISEGDKVAVVAESYAEMTSGKVYNNHYHLLVTVRDRRIAEVREYMDTLHAKQVFFGD